MAVLLSPAFIAIDSAQAAACTPTQNTYTGDGTNGTNGVSYTTFTISATGTCQLTIPPGVTRADVLIVGGGGGGAGGYTMTSSGGGGGGGGGAMVATNYPLTPLSTINITVGAGGTGGTSSSSGGAGANRDSSIGTQGGNTIFDSITAGGGGGAGYHSTNGFTTEVGKAGTAGGGGGGSSNHWLAYNSGNNTSNVTFASGGNGTSVTVGGQTYSAINGGTGGAYTTGSSGDNAGSGGGAAGNATSGASPAPGAGFSSYISGTQTTYGYGGLAAGASAWVAGTAPTGIGYGGTGGQQTTAGTNGNAGVVIFRILTPAVAVNSFGLSGAATSSTYRGVTTISINVTLASRVTFLAAGKKIPGCIKVSTSGTSPNIVATCSWRPSVHGNLPISAIIYPTGGAPNATTGPVSIGIAKRSGNR